MKVKLTQERLKELLHYNPDTGGFAWRVNKGKVKAGQPAGTTCRKTGYHIIGIDNKTHSAHRLCHLYMEGVWPVASIDHVNNLRHDNRWVNLRQVDHVINAQKATMREDNSSGYTGVHYNKNRSKYCARITVDKEIINLGSFKTFEEAVLARKTAEEKHGFGKNHGTTKLPTYRNKNKKLVPNRTPHKGSKKDFPISKIKELLSYDEPSGKFYWNVNTRQSQKGSVAGSKTKMRHRNQYIAIQLDGVRFKGHELAYLLKLGRFPKGVVDHIDHNGLNNSWNNLREVSEVENVRNRKLSENNTTGYHGIHQRKDTGRYMSRINDLEGKREYLGTFDTLEEAVKVRKKAEKKYGYHPNHGK